LEKTERYRKRRKMLKKNPGETSVLERGNEKKKYCAEQDSVTAGRKRKKEIPELGEEAEEKSKKKKKKKNHIITAERGEK